MAPPRLRILAGPSPDALVPITDTVNTTSRYKLSSDLFEGEIAVHIKDFTDEHGQVRTSDYFKREDRQGMTWSIQMSGRFLTLHNANDIMFGNIFDRRLKLPTGSGAALRFMQFIDPTLEHDLLSQTKPWALSPLIATMPHFSHQCIPIVDDNDGESISSSYSTLTSSQRLEEMARESSTDSQDSSLLARVMRKLGEKKYRALNGPNKDLQFDSASQRKKYFRYPEKRKQVELGPYDLISTDFCYGFLEFCPSLALRLPGGLTFDLMRYWDKHPVRFVCCERKKTGEEPEKEGEDPWGRMFWCVMIEIVDSSLEVG